ncbi:uncharacterized protein [Epargyreus clarus]|uniref:uncharacterized protein n=1 Tax=Epargyreus clarus TaxID=520877 RepID=UPI003C2B7482
MARRPPGGPAQDAPLLICLPPPGTATLVPAPVYFASRYRGLCTGTLVSRTAVITAAVCVTNPTSSEHDTRALTVITGAAYRHPRRGIRVQVTKILLPKTNNVSTHRGYLMQESPAILLLRRKVPDVLTETPLRAIEIDYKGEETLSLHQECLMPGWHFFYKGDKIYPVQRFLLQRNLRVQFLNIEKTHLWCDTLSIKFQKALINIGYTGHFDKTSCLCIRDPDHSAQPCHGMYGAPLICDGKVVAMLMAPDAQWSNCTGFTNIVNLLSGTHIKGFMECVSGFFEPEFILDWDAMKNTIYDEIIGGPDDYLPALYDKIVEDSTSSEEI